MADTLTHRGPDDSGDWESEDRHVALGHRRLSVIDLSPLGRNPMAWDDGRIRVTYNGEIYNFQDIRAELEGHGCRFRSHTDTEVILAAYDRWGLDAVRRFVGMFAFALWDATRQRLWIARDRFGQKPLYYATYNGVLSFGSELKALLADPAFPREIDRRALALYLRYGYVPSPCSIFRAARKLPPGHCLLLEKGRLTVSRYWDPVEHALQPRSPMADADAEAELDNRLRLAVTQREISDVPLGAFLSGGIDSSLVVALMQEHSTRPVRTFTIRFENPEYNEADHAAAVARHLGTDHYEQACGAGEMLDVVDALPAMFDEPFADSSAIPTYLVSKIARQRVTVALSGDGGDELFFGYPRYRYHADAGWALRCPGPVRHGVARAAAHLPTRRLRRISDILRSDESDRYGRFVAWWTPEEVQQLAGEKPSEPELYRDALSRIGSLKEAERPGVLDAVSYLPEDILTKVDRASMAVSLEVRAPLLDHRVAEFALGLPLAQKRQGGDTKRILRRLLYKRVPAALIDRPKMGFGVPLADWLRGPLREAMADYCSEHDMEDLGLDPAPVRTLWQAFLNGHAHRADLLWQMYCLVAWSRRCLSEAGVRVAG